MTINIGPPKGAILTHANLVSDISAYRWIYQQVSSKWGWKNIKRNNALHTYSLGKAKGEQKLSTFIDLKGSPPSLRLGSVSSRGCLDAPAVLPTRDPGREHLFIKKKSKVSRITAIKTSLFKSTEIFCQTCPKLSLSNWYIQSSSSIKCLTTVKEVLLG